MVQARTSPNDSEVRAMNKTSFTPFPHWAGRQPLTTYGTTVWGRAFFGEGPLDSSRWLPGSGHEPDHQM